MYLPEASNKDSNSSVRKISNGFISITPNRNITFIFSNNALWAHFHLQVPPLLGCCISTKCANQLPGEARSGSPASHAPASSNISFTANQEPVKQCSIKSESILRWTFLWKYPKKRFQHNGSNQQRQLIEKPDALWRYEKRPKIRPYLKAVLDLFHLGFCSKSTNWLGSCQEFHQLLTKKSVRNSFIRLRNSILAAPSRNRKNW